MSTFIQGFFITIVVLLAPFFLVTLGGMVYYRLFKHIEPIKREYPKPKLKKSKLKRIFFDFPLQFAKDMLTRNPNELNEYGFHLVCGEQGSGKTITFAWLLRYYKKKYPKVKIATNFNYKYQDSEIKSWKDIVFRHNGIYGQIDCIDEIQNWFSSAQSKDFPVEMITEITQQRKQHKVMFGSTQRFERMAKPLREQVNFVYYPITLFGCLTIVRQCKPTVSEDGSIKKLHTRKMFFFVHDDEIREAFDTYKKIAVQAKDGFIPSPFPQEQPVTTNVIVASKGGGKK